MTEIRRPIEWMEIDMQCDFCKEGRYRPTGKINLTDPPTWPHRCTGCGDTQTFRQKYPCTAYQPTTRTP